MGPEDRLLGAAVRAAPVVGQRLERFETTDDAFVAGDVTPLSARVSGEIVEMPVNDFEAVRKGQLLAVIDPSDYQARLDLANANLAAAQATLANLANQRTVQEALVRQGSRRTGRRAISCRRRSFRRSASRSR